jgi:bifunctional non-homologous end joining protein LigD
MIAWTTWIRQREVDSRRPCRTAHGAAHAIGSTSVGRVGDHGAMERPAFIAPMLATLVGAPFDDPDWLFEVKWDGFRIEAVVDGEDVRLWTRGELDGARYFGSFLAPPTWIAARSAVVDGEVIALDERGEPDFALLQARIKGKDRATAAASPFVFEAFDLLHIDGRSLLDEPLEARRLLLADVLRADARVRLSEHVDGTGLAFFEAARVRGLEGIMAKDRRSTYVPGKRTDRWQKVKIRPEQELIVGGWATGTGKAVDLGALLVGVYDDGRLRYAGKVGAGFTNVTRAELLDAVGRLSATESPFAEALPRPVARTANWVRPELVIRAEFAGWTGDGLVRQAAYKGLDLGKDPRLVVRERPAASLAVSKATSGGRASRDRG